MSCLQQQYYLLLWFPSMGKSKIEHFLDSDGRIISWPAKSAVQLLLLSYLASKFEIGRTYSEKEVNEIIKKWHTFYDWSLLRREMYNRKLFNRKPDGTNYYLLQDNNTLEDKS